MSYRIRLVFNERYEDGEPPRDYLPFENYDFAFKEIKEEGDDKIYVYEVDADEYFKDP